MNAPAPSAASIRRAIPPADTPVASAEFDRLMSAVGPFEAAPRLLVAVSGGADSMALALLARDWCRKRRGDMLAVTVDHGLRDESRDEARQVADWLAAWGTAHRIVRWRGDKPGTGVQAAARHARYALLTREARKEGIFHLITAHHADDQAETFLMRLERGSGVAGLAGMAAVSHARDVRLVRPLLPVAKARLVATLAAADQGWVEDPSNRDLRHTRIRVRRRLARLAERGLGADSFCDAAGAIAGARRDMEADTAAALAAVAWIAPDGAGQMDLAAFRALPCGRRARVLARLVTVIGANAYEPRTEKLRRVVDAMQAADWRGATLGHCRLQPGNGVLHLARESLRRAVIPHDSTMGYKEGSLAPAAGFQAITPLCEGRLYLADGDS